jgi:hypothetical protein
MSYYVKRVNTDGRGGWTGPIRSERQARKEQSAWESVGWVAWVEESTPAIRAEVRAWQKARDLEHGRAR